MLNSISETLKNNPEPGGLILTGYRPDLVRGNRPAHRLERGWKAAKEKGGGLWMADPTIDMAAFYEEYFPEIYNYFFFRFLSKETAEDLTSKTFLKVIAHLGQYDPTKSSLRTWLWRIAKNTMIDFFRTGKVTASLDEEAVLAQGVPSVSFEEQYSQLLSPKRKLTYQALWQLCERDRMLVYHKYFLGWSYHAIAEEFALNESTLASILSRAKEKMRVFLQAQDDT